MRWGATSSSTTRQGNPTRVTVCRWPPTHERSIRTGHTSPTSQQRNWTYWARASWNRPGSAPRRSWNACSQATLRQHPPLRSAACARSPEFARTVRRKVRRNGPCWYKRGVKKILSRYVLPAALFGAGIYLLTLAPVSRPFLAYFFSAMFLGMGLASAQWAWSGDKNDKKK